MWSVLRTVSSVQLNEQINKLFWLCGSYILELVY